MGIAERIRTRIQKLWSGAPSMASSDLLRLYHQNPRLDGVRIIAEKCASTDLYLYDRKDYRQNKRNAVIIDEAEIYNLLENPCPTFRDLTGWSVRYFVFACYTLVGEAYLLKVRDEKGNVIALLPISPAWVIKQPTAGAEYWEIYPFGSTQSKQAVFPANDVIIFKDIDLLDPYGRGKGTAETIGDEIQTDEYSAKYAKNLFFNDATPSAIIYAPQGTKETADQIKQSWLQKMAGLNHAKEPMVLTGEGSKFEKIANSPQELDFVNSRKFLRDSALQQFHIPPEITGILENSNRSTIDSAFYLLNKNVLADYLRMYERVMNSQLLWEDFDRNRDFILVHENTIEEDTEQKLRIVNEGLMRGVLTVNDWRRAMGYEPDERSGDVYLRSMATVEIPFEHEEIELPELPEEQPEEITLPETEPDQTENGTEPEKELSEAEFKQIKAEYEKKYRFAKSEEDKKRREKIWKAFDVRARKLEEPFIKQSRKAFSAQKKLVIAIIKKACDENKDVGTAIENLYDKNMNEALKRTLAPAFIAGLTQGAEIGLENLGRKAHKDISENVRRLLNLWIENYGLELCTDINDTTKKNLRRVLADATYEGDSIEEKKKKLIEVAEKEFIKMDEVRALLIARTESCATLNAGSNELYKAEGVQYKEWISTLDDRTRDAHLVMDGVVIPINDKFDVPTTSETIGGFLEYPGDPTADISNVANCRCTLSGFATFDGVSE